MREYKVICLTSGDKGIIKAEKASYARLRFAQKIKHKFPRLPLVAVIQLCSAQAVDPKGKGGRPRYNIKWGE